MACLRRKRLGLSTSKSCLARWPEYTESEVAVYADE